MVTSSVIWTHLPNYFAFIQYPPRLLLLATPILTLIISLPFILIQDTSRKMFLSLSALAVFIVAFTFKFNNYELYNIGNIDYTTFSIIQATGLDSEYLPVAAKTQSEYLEKRPRIILPVSNTTSSTPSAVIVTNQTPYLRANISNNENKETKFELPRLFYAGYELKWKAAGNNKVSSLSYSQSENGLIITNISGNGSLEVQYTGGKWYWLSCLASLVALGYLLWLLYRNFFFVHQRV